MGKALVILILHWGGFTGGGPANVAPAVHALHAAGLPAIAPRYPLGSARRAEEWTAHKVRRLHGQHKRVLLYGASAGGTIAVSLAQRGIADGAVALAPVTDLTTWGLDVNIGSPRNRRIASPLFQRCNPKAPVLVIHARDDTVVPYAQSLAYTRRCGYKLVSLQNGGHNIVAFPNRVATSYLKRLAREH